MRVKVTETTVYNWDELSDGAKDNARQDHSRFLWESGEMSETIEDLFNEKMESLGWVNLDNLNYNLYMQGGEPTWTGDLPEFEFEGRTYYVTVRNQRGYMTVDIEDDTDTDDELSVREYVNAVDAAKDMVNSLSYDLLYAFRGADEWAVNDENMAATCEANEYEFTEDGELA